MDQSFTARLFAEITFGDAVVREPTDDRFNHPPEIPLQANGFAPVYTSTSGSTIQSRRWGPNGFHRPPTTYHRNVDSSNATVVLKPIYPIYSELRRRWSARAPLPDSTTEELAPNWDGDMSGRPSRITPTIKDNIYTSGRWDPPLPRRQ